MFKTKAVDPNQFPVPDTKRISTDLFCTILGAIFALAMFIIAVVMWNKCKCLAIQNLLKITFLTLKRIWMGMLVMAISILQIPTIPKYIIYKIDKLLCISMSSQFLSFSRLLLSQ